MGLCLSKKKKVNKLLTYCHICRAFSEDNPNRLTKYYDIGNLNYEFSYCNKCHSLKRNFTIKCDTPKN